MEKSLCSKRLLQKFLFNIIPLPPTGVRKPFGEITTNTPPPKPTTPMTPAAATASSSTPNEEAALTPMANLKLLMKVSDVHYQSPELKFRFVFFQHQMLRFSALCGPNE